MKHTPKNNLTTILSGIVFTVALSSCGPLEKVTLTKETDPVDGHLILESYASLTMMVAQQRNFILVITNSSCLCTIEFLPIFDTYLSEQDIAGYTLEYTNVLYQSEKFGLAVDDGNSPIIGIFGEGQLKHQIEYVVGDERHNRVFTSYEYLSDYLGDRIDVA